MAVYCAPMQRTDASVDEFVRGLPDGVRADVAALDAMLSDIFAGHERVLWQGKLWGGTDQRIIGYGSLRQARPNGSAVDWFQVGLAVQKAHISSTSAPSTTASTWSSATPIGWARSRSAAPT
jgi:hypothetical protein